jgi:hypothetical protein
MHATVRRLGVGALAALIATAGFAIPAHAATAPTTFPATSDGPVYLVDSLNNVQYPAGTTLPWDAPSGVNLTSTVPALSRLPFVAGSLTSTPFISAVGAERTPASWKAYSDPVNLNGQGVNLPNVTPSSFLGGSTAGIISAGGTYSLGVAYLSNPTTVTAAFYTTINVDAGTGDWAFATPITKAPTTTALTTSATTGVAVGDPVTFTATVSSTTATGNVTFNEGSTVLGTSASAAGVATLTTSALAAGTHSITATYVGDLAFNASTSSAVTVTVQGTTGPDSTLLIAGNAFPAPYNAPTVTGTVATLSLPATLNGKKVNVFGYSSPTFLAQVTISGGSLQVNVASFSAGTHQIAIVDAASGTILGWVTVTITNAAQTATRDLQAVIATSIDGTFALVGPANASPAVIGNPTLDSITGESVSTGTLGQFTVKDDRSISKKGWTLTADVNNFVNGGATVSKNALGIKPAFGTSVTGPGLPVLGAERVAGSTTAYPMPFAGLAAGTYSTNTDLNAGLTFRAPLGTPSGTYTSTLTLTLVSL